MELLKQPQNSPYVVQDQVASIWAGTNGFLDDLEVNEVLSFESGLLDYLHSNSSVLDEIAATGELTKENEEKLRSCVEAFHSQWVSARKGAGNLDDGEVQAERSQEQIVRSRPAAFEA